MMHANEAWAELAAIGGLSTIGIVAIQNGVNGEILMVIVGAIAALGGYILKNGRDKSSA